MRTEKTRALITGMIWGMSSWKATPGSSFSPSMVEAMGRKGTRMYPATMDIRVASTVLT